MMQLQWEQQQVMLEVTSIFQVIPSFHSNNINIGSSLLLKFTA